MFSENKRKYILFFVPEQKYTCFKNTSFCCSETKNNTKRPLKLIVMLKVFMLEQATGI